MLVVPARVAPLGFAPSASLTSSVALGTVLPSASCTATRTAGAIASVPSTFAGGWVRNVSCAAGPTIANGALTPDTRPARAWSV